jgi:hypothetical protein
VRSARPNSGTATLSRTAGEGAERALRDDMRVLTAIVLRHENQLERINASMAEMLNQMRAMVAQHQRFGDRLLALDDRVNALDDDRR